MSAFAPGRANLIGEHTDYNGGLALPFAIEQGITVTPGAGDAATDSPYVRGVIAELGLPAGVTFGIESTLAQGAGLSSSAALTVALIRSIEPDMAPLDVAKLGQRVENEYAGADTGLLDQLAILLGEPGKAVRIDFKTLTWRTVPLDLGDWTLALIDSGATHDLATGGYNERRAECRDAADRLHVDTLTDADRTAAQDLPDPLDRRTRHVLDENDRVDATIAALEQGDLKSVGDLLDASHASLRDLYDASVPEVERTVERAKQAGATGARMMGGGFGGTVIALFPPGATPPDDARPVRPSAGASVL